MSASGGDRIAFEEQPPGGSGGPTPATSVTYTPAVPSDWSPPPTQVAGGLDQLAARVTALESATMQRPSTSTPSSVSVTTASTPLLSANANRQGFALRNDGSVTMYWAFGTMATTASSESLDPGGEYLDSTGWIGAVSAITATSTTTARITELTP